MRRALLLLALFTLLTAVSSAAPRTLLVVGDSLSAAYGMDVSVGWVRLLEERLRQDGHHYKVINASISGDTTANGRARLPALLRHHRPAIVVIELGGNDGLRGLSPEQMRENIRAMIAAAKERGARVLLLGVELPTNYGPKYNDKFRAVYRDLGTELGVTVVPSFLDGVATDAALMLPDRIHPNAKAQPRLLDNIWPTLQRLL
ncbi:MAG: arylesterase [Pseudomonadota bacterium]|nr:MAG: arylesterase [Pseudomonadota bacterium]